MSSDSTISKIYFKDFSYFSLKRNDKSPSNKSVIDSNNNLTSSFFSFYFIILISSSFYGHFIIILIYHINLSNYYLFVSGSKEKTVLLKKSNFIN